MNIHFRVDILWKKFFWTFGLWFSVVDVGDCGDKVKRKKSFLSRSLKSRFWTFLSYWYNVWRFMSFLFYFEKKKKKIGERVVSTIAPCRVLLVIKNEFYCISFYRFSRPVFSYRLWQREIPTWISFCNGKGHFLAQQIPFESGQIVKHFFVMAALA